MKSGVCSVTLRSLSSKEIVALVARSGLEAIEWGGDVHVPAGDLAVAKEVKAMTEESGLKISSYGSYYKVFDDKGRRMDFAPVLASALELGTDTIRIWAGTQPSDAVGDLQRQRLLEGLREDLEQARESGVRLALEFHANTLSDSNAATCRVLGELNDANLFTYWQPVYWLADSEYRIEGLRRLAGKVLNFHVFQWLFRPGAGSWGESTERRPLVDGEEEWLRFLSVPLPDGVDRYALMEFVKGDDPLQFLEDAQALLRWLKP
ncbi:sugar phosphate isomerase/epimerase [Pelagicoccus enzymogenes]|uniref:sugar phosphate isomerase/epimerase family protein n=1 Tax=Pelagicoccus enzymogenes TaxID=2773457 RepID=UPI00280C5AAC|nr:sugar phosphate isomerase/epimerase [Pelagicoccus enzymogenes]MDQ8198257.1 sugar phosphate isomerase/epimerase [Pelagicoccus enzymogenes]